MILVGVLRPRNGLARLLAAARDEKVFFGSQGASIIVLPVPPSGPFLSRNVNFQSRMGSSV